MNNILVLFLLAVVEMKYTFIRFKIKVEYFIEDNLVKIMYVGSLSMLAYIYLMGERLSEFETIILNIIIIIFTITIFGKTWYDHQRFKQWSALSDKQRNKIIDDLVKSRKEKEAEIKRLS